MDPHAFDLKQNPIMARLEACGLSADLLAELVGRHTPVRYPKGTMLFLQGSPADVLFAIQSGFVKTYCPSTDGGRILVELSGPGSIVGHADLVDATAQRSQIFEAQALTNCCVALITRHHLVKLLKDVDSQTLLRLVEALNSYWSGSIRHYAQFLGMTLRQRLEMVFTEMALKFGIPDSRGTLLATELSQEELAEMIGSSRPMVSKLLADMAVQGTVAREGRHYILLGRESRTSQRALSRTAPQPAAHG